MEQYVGKDALKAEIDRRLDELYELLPDASKVERGTINISEACNTGKYTALESFKNYLDTLETKEVGSIWNDARKTIPEDSSNQIICIKEDDLAVATVGKLVHGTKKWAYLHDLLNISNVQVKPIDLDKEIHKFIDKEELHLRLWDVDRIAKHFYELGIRAAQKGE